VLVAAEEGAAAVAVGAADEGAAGADGVCAWAKTRKAAANKGRIIASRRKRGTTKWEWKAAEKGNAPCRNSAAPSKDFLAALA